MQVHYREHRIKTAHTFVHRVFAIEAKFWHGDQECVCIGVLFVFMPMDECNPSRFFAPASCPQPVFGKNIHFKLTGGQYKFWGVRQFKSIK